MPLFLPLESGLFQKSQKRLLWKSGKVASSLALTMVLLGALALGGVMLFGEQQVETRVSQLASLDADRIDQMNARRAIWKADLKAIQEFPILGYTFRIKSS